MFVVCFEGVQVVIAYTLYWKALVEVVCTFCSVASFAYFEVFDYTIRAVLFTGKSYLFNSL